MANVVSDNLHRLIKSMTKAEKRYFRIFSSRHILGDENNYRILFSAIDKQEEYDEDKLLKKFKDKQFINRFSISKNRLYNAILKSLDSFHSVSSIEAQLNRQVHSAEILYHKSLYDQSAKLLNSARKVAEKYEKFSVLASISRWEKRIMEKDNYTGVGSGEVSGMRDSDRALISKLRSFDELWNIKARIFQALFSRGKVRSSNEEAELVDILKELSEKFDVNDSTVESRYMFNQIYGAFHFGKGQYEECFPYLQSNIDLINDYPHLFDEEPNMYLSVLSNAIYVGIRLSRWDEADANLEKLRSFPTLLESQMNEDLQARVFTTLKSTELTLFAHTNNYEKGVALVPDIESGIKQFGDKISSIKRAQLYFNISVVYLGDKKFHEAVKWINKLLNDVEIDNTQDIHCMARMLNLLVHLELGNRDLLPYALRSAQRNLQVRRKVYKFEKIFLDFINENLKKRQEKKETELFTEFIAEMEALKQDPFEALVFEYFDFHAWAVSHLNGKLEKNGRAA